MKRTRLGLVVLMATSGILMAQETSQKKTGKTNPTADKKMTSADSKPGAAAGSSQSMFPKPSPEMMKLSKAMIGTWNTTETYEKSQWAPNGGSGKGVEVIKPGPGGLSIIQDYRSSNFMGHFSGHGVLSWDPTENDYRAFWIDNMDPRGMVTTGKMDGDKLVMEGDGEMNGQKFKVRETISDLTPNSFSFTMESSYDGGNTYKKDMTIEYKKANAPGGETKPGAGKQGDQ